MSALVTFAGGADLLEGSSELPFAPGAASHTGSARLYRGLMRAAEKRYPGGRSAFLAAQPPPLRAFLDRDFNELDRVDVWPFFMAIVHLAKKLGQAPAEYLNAAAIDSARRDFSGTRRHVLKLVSNRTITVGVLALNKLWWDFLKFKTQSQTNGIKISATGLPAGLRNGILLLGGAYTAEVLRLSGTASARYEPGDFKGETPLRVDTIGEGSFSLYW